jgi:hypothetical protein
MEIINEAASLGLATEEVAAMDSPGLPRVKLNMVTMLIGTLGETCNQR